MTCICCGLECEDSICDACIASQSRALDELCAETLAEILNDDTDMEIRRDAWTQLRELKAEMQGAVA